MKKLFIALALVFVCGSVWPAATVTLKYGCHMLPDSTLTELVTLPFLDAVTKATDKQVQFETHFSESLLKFFTSWDDIAAGTADMGWIALWPFYGRTPLANAVDLPVFAFPTAADRAGALWQLYEKYPEIQAEFQIRGIRPLLFLCSNPLYLFTNQPVSKLEDLRDMQLLTSSPATVRQFKYFDATHIIEEPLYKIFEMRDQPSIGMVAGAEVYMLWNLKGITPYATVAPMNDMFYTVAISEKRWQTLPSEIREQIMSVSGYEASRQYSAAYFDHYNATLRADANAPQYITLSAEEWKRWADMNPFLVDEWMEAAAKRGQEAVAQNIYNDLQAKWMAP